MIRKLDLTESQHLGFDKYADERAMLEAREARFLAACLRELGGKIEDPWRFDRVTRVFYVNVPDEQRNGTD